jgi:hypothetical protein
MIGPKAIEVKIALASLELLSRIPKEVDSEIIAPAHSLFEHGRDSSSIPYYARRPIFVTAIASEFPIFHENE